MHARAALHIIAPEVDVNAKLREANIINCTVRKLTKALEAAHSSTWALDHYCVWF